MVSLPGKMHGRQGTKHPEGHVEENYGAYHGGCYKNQRLLKKRPQPQE